ncbi:Hypothetical protein R9X50_00703200 [Acrodontium crateriforme]|uniref:Cytochrome c oxidase polypeptide V n=1 Tax=Acrodontium crateriforme TaxID=150365 RepID=A0AAQ3R788_9PEZI|nr:Hypothetical protein R9X50_00703200 [Acrodontium crateriforme]
MSNMMRATPLFRAAVKSTSAARLAPASCLVASSPLSSQQTRQAHAISNPTLANIEKRWEAMPPQEQAELWMALRDRMKVDWNDLTLQEKRAAYWIAFGPHGPRAHTPPGEGTKVFMYTAGLVGISAALFFGVRSFRRGPPPSMNKEWQEASNEYMKENNIEPITGVSSEGYKGPGMVQSDPAPKS